MQLRSLSLGVLGALLILGLFFSATQPTTIAATTNSTTTTSSTTTNSTTSNAMNSIYQFYEQHKLLVWISIAFIGLIILVSLFAKR